MNNLSKGCLFRILMEIFKFLFVFTIFGMIALPTIAFSLAIIDYLETGSSEMLYILQETSGDATTVISFLIEGMTSSVPFDGLFELLIDQSDRIKDSSIVLSGLLSFIKGICDKETIVPAFKNYIPELFQDIVVATVASLFFFLFARLNKLLMIFNGFAAHFAFHIISVLWYYASFCCAQCLVLFIKVHTLPAALHIVLFLIFLIAFLLHALFLSCAMDKNDSQLLRSLVILGIDAIFGVITALVLWSLKSTLYGLFNIFNGTSIVIFIIVAFFLRVLEDIKSVILKQSTFTLFTIFAKKGKSF